MAERRGGAWAVGLALLAPALGACAGATEAMADPPGQALPPSAPGIAPPAATGPSATATSATTAAPPAPAPRTHEPLTEATVRETVRSHYDRVGTCYAAGLERDPTLVGTIEVHLSIGEDGKVVAAFADKDEAGAGKAGKRKPKPRRRTKDDEPRITDAEVVGCIEGVFTSITFPASGRGLVNLVYPVVLRSE